MNHFGMYFHLWHHSKITKILSTAILLLFTWAWEVYPVMAALQDKKEFERIQAQQMLEQALQFFRTIQTLREQLQPNERFGKQSQSSNTFFSPAINSLLQGVSQTIASPGILYPLRQLPDFVKNVMSEEDETLIEDANDELQTPPAQHP